MRVFRWFIGLLIIGGFFFINFFVLPDIPFNYKLINVLLFCSLFILIRVVKGPSVADRIVAIDILGILIIGICAILAIALDRSYFIDIGIAWGLQSFIGAMALAKFLEGRSLDA
ncbi:MAG TPA: multiple resistance and pH regulation protein F [Candidatus Cloacimonetes bacterium]|nr:multiple resistance and pH regulation protein F [Candidatus Cloacimonadota bacterium]HEX38100.1 multiple resistance and pH regulation protein F [Candidatus Cloacimonadota bacterium]